MRHVPTTYRQTGINLERTNPSKTGLAKYEDWLKQESRADEVTAQQTPAVSFQIVLLTPAGSNSAADATRRSVLDASERLSSVRITEANVNAEIDMHQLDSEVDFVLILRAGDLLSHDALYEIAVAYSIDPEAKLISFDSDQVTAKGKRIRPFFRPQWSPEMLLGANYIGAAVAYRRSVFATHPLKSFDARDRWEQLLDLSLDGHSSTHLSKVLLSEVESTPAKLTHDDAAMVQAVLKKHGETSTVSVSGAVLRVIPEPAVLPSVSVIVPTRHSRKNLTRLLTSFRMTDYPDLELVIVDNGGESDENNDWYSLQLEGLDASVRWWTEQPFNYSRVNNFGAACGRGDVVLFLNDDTEIVDSSWLRQIVGHLMRDGVGSVGLQMREGQGLIQHAGVMIGPGGFADNLFAGMMPHSETIIGPTDWYRNTLATTGACVALKREDFDQVGGLDERFILMGSDVVLGLDQIIKGRRNVVIPLDLVRHYESLTRGSTVPEQDLYASYWRYYPWLQRGDPYVSENVCRLSSTPKFRYEYDPEPVDLALRGLGRPIRKQAQTMGISAEANALISTASITRQTVAAVHASHEEHAEPFEIKTINWFIPEIDMPFFGGLNTAFRLAHKLSVEHGVHNRFVVLGEPNELFLRTALDAAFAGLGTDCSVAFYNGTDEELARVPAADAAVATLWLTAIHVAKSRDVKRRFYLVQDYEPEFYPASSMFAMAEESYRLGLYGLCNTTSMHKVYTEEYKGKGVAFVPAVDRTIYHPEGRRVKTTDDPVTIFAYARDHFRNCWELVYAALSRVKEQYGDRVKVIVAGARYLPPTANFLDLGLMDYRATARHYRDTDIGITMQISRHPSYLPLELMSCGVPMVAPDSEWFTWIFDDGKNSSLTMRSVDDMVYNLSRLIDDAELRASLSKGALSTIDEHHSDWDAALSGIYSYMCNPEGK